MLVPRHRGLDRPIVGQRRTAVKRRGAGGDRSSFQRIFPALPTESAVRKLPYGPARSAATHIHGPHDAYEIPDSLPLPAAPGPTPTRDDRRGTGAEDEAA